MSSNEQIFIAIKIYVHQVIVNVFAAETILCKWTCIRAFQVTPQMALQHIHTLVAKVKALNIGNV